VIATCLISLCRRRPRRCRP